MRPAIDYLGLEHVIEQGGVKRVADQVGAKRLLDQLGLRRFIEEAGKKEAMKLFNVDDILANLSPADRRKLKRRLE